MGINGLAPWLGSKRTMASIIAEELGPHRAYFEPFCGSMAVLFGKQVSASETVNDLHSDLINLARVLASNRAAELHAKCISTLFHEMVQRESAELIRSVPCVPAESIESVTNAHIQRAWHYFVASWGGRNGTAGCPNYTAGSASVRWTPNGGSSSVRFAAAADSMPAWHQRMRRVVILQRDAFELLANIADDPDTAIYCDPPYILETRGSGCGSKYMHDFEAGDHARLAAALLRFTKARVVVSYYAHPMLSELYQDWTILEHPRLKSLSLGKRDAPPDVAPEVLIVNGRSFTQGNGLLF